MNDQEFSPSGDPIYRYENIYPKEFLHSKGEWKNIEAISDHIEKHVGVVDTVFHEIVSHRVHIDIHWVKPSEAFPFHTLVTSGMSDVPMNVPEGLSSERYAEVCILLPEYWLNAENDYATLKELFKDENIYWPVRWLKQIALFPHEYDTWVGRGHTIPNGAEAAPFAGNTKLGCMILFPSVSLGKDFFSLPINEDKTIHFYCLYPLYKEEMDYKLKKGTGALLDKFAKKYMSDIVDPDRENLSVKKGLFGWW